MTEINMIIPHKIGSIWIFDDIVTGLVGEVFVESASAIIDVLVQEADIEGANSGFLLLFSSSKFPESTRLNWVSCDGMGNWYEYHDYTTGKTLQGWLCPALLQYFEDAPKYLFVQALAMRKN